MSVLFRLELATGRRAVLFGLAALAIVGSNAAYAQHPLSVLFVCQSGTAKSAIAREFFRRRAAERGIPVTVFSRGLVIENHVSPPLRAKLTGEGIDPTRDGNHLLTRSDIRAADVVIFFNPLPPELRPIKARDWSALPSVNDDWPDARADLIRRIDALLDELARPAKPAR